MAVALSPRLLALLVAIALTSACAEEPLRPLDSPCSLATECESGFCMEGLCLRKSDDFDGDCISNQDDPTVDDPAVVRASLCKTVGVCSPSKVSCPAVGNTPSCDYSGAANYEPGGETRCDFLDNDCDGIVDNVVEGLTCCQDAGDCDDGDPCTTEVCSESNRCVRTPVDSLLCEATCTDTLMSVVSAPAAMGAANDVSIQGANAYIGSDYGVLSYELDVTGGALVAAELWARPLHGGAIAKHLLSHESGVWVADDRGFLHGFAVNADGSVTTEEAFDLGVEVSDLMVPSTAVLTPGTAPAIVAVVHPDGVDFWSPTTAGLAAIKHPQALAATAPLAIAAFDDHLFVAGDGTYRVLDGSGLGDVDSEIAEIGSIAAPDIVTVTGTVLVEDAAIVIGTDTLGEGRVTFVDLTDPAAPLVLGGFISAETYTAVAVSPAGDIAYLASNLGVDVMALDPLDVALSTVSSSVLVPNNGTLAVGADTLALSSGDAGAVFRSVAALNDAASGAVVHRPPQVMDALAVGGRAFVALGADGLGTVSLSALTSPADPIEVPSTLEILGEPGFDNVHRLVRLVAAQQDFIAAVALDGAVALVDVSEDTSGGPITAVGNLDAHEDEALGGLALSAAGHLYLAYGIDGVTVLDVSNPAAPSSVDTIAAPGLGQARDVAIAGTRLYLAAGDVGLVVYSINAGTVVPLATFSDLGAIDRVSVNEDGTKVAVRLAGEGAEPSTGIAVIDVTNGAAPSLVGQVSSPEGAVVGRRMAWRQNNVAVAGGHGGALLLSMTDTGLELVATYPAAGFTGGACWTLRDYLLVADDLASLTVLQPVCSQ